MKKLVIFILFLNTILCTNLFAAKSLYLSYKNIPKKVYTNQRFEVVIKALVIGQDTEDTLISSFSNAQDIKLLNPNSKWEKVSPDTYENKYYFKVGAKPFRFPNIKVKLLRNSNLLDISTLLSRDITYSSISKNDKRFSNIIADDIQIKAYKTKQYNNSDALTIVDIDGKNANLKDFKLTGIKEQGVSKFEDKIKSSNLIYYFVTPVHQKNLKFTYYNTITRNFKEVLIPLILQNELVSTQTDLDPNESGFEKYKKIAALVLFIIFLVLFIWKRKKFLLVLTLIFLIISVIYFIPNQTGMVKKDSYVYILPTKNSTIFFKLDDIQKVEKLQKRNGFIKVKGIDKKFIGWIKEESFGKN